MEALPRPPEKDGALRLVIGGKPKSGPGRSSNIGGSDPDDGLRFLGGGNEDGAGGSGGSEDKGPPKPIGGRGGRPA